MGNINISPRMAHKSVVRDIQGNIIHMTDEKTGGAIIRNRQIVNPERWEEIQRIEQDKREAAKAIQHQIVSPNAEARNVNPSEMGKIKQLEERMNGQDEKLDAILALLKK